MGILSEDAHEFEARPRMEGLLLLKMEDNIVTNIRSKPIAYNSV